MIKKIRAVNLKATKKNPLLDSVIPKAEFWIDVKQELENLLYLADIYKIDINAVNDAGIDLALAIARNYVKDFSPTSTVRGNPRNAYEEHKELFEAVKATKAQDLTTKAAIEKYRAGIKTGRPSYKKLENDYNKARTAKKKQDEIIDGLMEKHFKNRMMLMKKYFAK